MKPLVYFDGTWRDASAPLLPSLSHAFMYGNSVFDGARAFNGWVPDLDLHCARAVQSAKVLKFDPKISPEELIRLSIEGIMQFPEKSELYIRPAFFGGTGFAHDYNYKTEFVLNIMVAPMPPEDSKGQSLTLSSYNRPDPKTAPTSAKATCLYPLNKLIFMEAQGKGFDNALVAGLDGQIFELATANVFCVKKGVVYTPAPHPSYLNGITRQRMIQLLAAAGVKVVEKTMHLDEFLGADEIFSTGNYSKLMWVNRLQDIAFKKGPVYTKARKLYWDFAATQTVAHYQGRAAA